MFQYIVNRFAPVFHLFRHGSIFYGAQQPKAAFSRKEMVLEGRAAVASPSNGHTATTERGPPNHWETGAQDARRLCRHWETGARKSHKLRHKGISLPLVDVERTTIGGER